MFVVVVVVVAKATSVVEVNDRLNHIRLKPLQPVTSRGTLKRRDQPFIFNHRLQSKFL